MYREEFSLRWPGLEGVKIVNSKLLSGTVDLLILEVVGSEPTYGYEITQTVMRRSQGQLELKEGSLYPCLHRLERQRLLAPEWRQHDGRRRKYYRLTPTGQKTLQEKRTEWLSFPEGVRGVLGGAHGVA